MKHYAYDTVRKAVNEAFKECRFSPKLLPFASSQTGNIVIATEKDNFLNKKDTFGATRETKVFIQFDIYAKDTAIGTNTFSRYTVAREIADIIDDICSIEYGLHLDTSKPTPSLDKDVYKITMIYRVTQIDTRCRFF